MKSTTLKTLGDLELKKVLLFIFFIPQQMPWGHVLAFALSYFI